MCTVLLIDDDLVQHFLIKQLLNKFASVDDLTCYLDASKAFSDLQFSFQKALKGPNFIFVDLNMPGMNGWEFLNAYQQLIFNKSPHTQVYILSSSVDRRDILHAEQYPFVKGFLTKPLSQHQTQEILMTT
jgi:CheY-like chemotaxis protein